MRIFLPTRLTPPLRENPSEFLYETYRAKTRRMGLLYGENRMILTSAVFCMNHPCERQTERRTDGRNCDSICALTAYMLSRAKTLHRRFSHSRDVGKWQIFVRWWCSLVVFVAGVRSRRPCSGVRLLAAVDLPWLGRGTAAVDVKMVQTCFITID